ncbi:hypothetical protein B14911_07800 [Bacillus sp. NRRL B-14911]|nr:hypothetical protein B14911_07800 [Bacillus sp. NRRL B-14911]
MIACKKAADESAAYPGWKDYFAEL